MHNVLATIVTTLCNPGASNAPIKPVNTTSVMTLGFNNDSQSFNSDPLSAPPPCGGVAANE